MYSILFKSLIASILIALSHQISLVKNPTLQQTEHLAPCALSISNTRTLIVYSDSYNDAKLSGQLIDENGVLVGSEIAIHSSS